MIDGLVRCLVAQCIHIAIYTYYVVGAICIHGVSIGFAMVMRSFAI